jgi:hypothetical protein
LNPKFKNKRNAYNKKTERWRIGENERIKYENGEEYRRIISGEGRKSIEKRK